MATNRAVTAGLSARLNPLSLRPRVAGYGARKAQWSIACLYWRALNPPSVGFASLYPSHEIRFR